MVDTTVVDFHRVPVGGLVVSRIDGTAVLVLENGRRTAPLELGRVLSVGDTVAVERGGRVVASDLALVGGANGRAHSFVADDAFRSKPGRDDVPEIIRQLNLMGQRALGDPFVGQTAPSTPYERAASTEFARVNLDESVARELTKESAHALRAVPLFLSEDTAFVAMDRLDASRMVGLMAELSRPVNPHLVTSDVLDEVLERIFGPPEG